MPIPLIALIAFLLAGCTVMDSDVPVSSSNSPVAPDASVLVADAETLIGETLAEYITVTNRIVSGDAPVESINDLTTTEWAIEESSGFAALEALGGNAAMVSMTRWQLSAVRGTHTLVDALVAACLGGTTDQTRVTIRLLPRDGELVIAEISPWEDSSWCVDSPSL